MGEIKSTFDLVMEKTRHLTLSDDEKQNNKKEDIANKIKVLIVKYEDGTLRFSEFEKEMNSLRKSSGDDVQDQVAANVLERLDIRGGNDPLMNILEEYCGRDTLKVQAAIDRFQEKLSQAAHQRSQSILEGLKKEQRISGSAVAANLEGDDVLESDYQDLQAQFKGALAT